MRKEDRFITLIKDHEGVLFKVTRMYTENEADQKDLYQEIVFQLWKGLDRFRGEAKASTWMYRVALNTAFTYLRRKKRSGHRVSLEKIDLCYEPHDPLLEERLAQLYAQIKQLSDVEKGIMFLLLEGKKYEEIAAITGFSRSKVATRISRIKQKLKKQLEKA